MKVSIVGCTGAVGQEALNCLEQTQLPVTDLNLIASARSSGIEIDSRFGPRKIREISEDALNCDYALFCADSDISRTWAPVCQSFGGTVIDNSSAFRMSQDIPLVIPEINGNEMTKSDTLFANPNCSTIIALMALGPIHAENPLTRVNISTYQAASGAGAQAMQELIDGTRANLAGENFTPQVFTHQSAFNVFSHDSEIDSDTGYNGEELKIRDEIRKILKAPELAVSATCIRVPVMRAHTEAILFQCKNATSAPEILELYNGKKGIRIINDEKSNTFPMPIDAADQNDVLVGRIRQDLGDSSGRSFWLLTAGDQLRKGAALNAVQILEHLHYNS